MRPKPYAKLLSYISRHAGKKLSIKQIKHEFAGKLQTRPNQKQKKTKKRSHLSLLSRNPSYTIEDILEGLAAIGAVKIQSSSVLRKTIIPRKPFQLEGKVSLSPRGIAFVSILGTDKSVPEIFVSPWDTLGALHGDVVILKLKGYSKERFEGQITAICQRDRSQYRLQLRHKPDAHKKVVVGTLLDMPARFPARLSTTKIPSKLKAKLKPNAIVIVSLDIELDHYMGRTIHKANFIRFEQDTDLDLDLERILMRYNLSHKYPQVDGELKDIPTYEEPNPDNTSDWQQRLDLRQLYTITIDGTNSKDFDDALSLEIHSANKATLYVHIADVNYYIVADTPLDKEAQRRGTSYYLANHVIPMLPKVLSEKLCSLIADKNRLSVSVKMEVDLEDGSIRKSTFHRSIIRVDHRFTYGQAEQELDKMNTSKNQGIALLLKQLRSQDPAFAPTFLAVLWQLAQAQRRRRMQSGRIDLNFPEPAIHWDSHSSIQNITYKARLKSSILIEECMLSANTSVAAFIQQKKIPVLHRNHEPMDLGKLEQLNAFCSACGLVINLKDNHHQSIQKALNTVKAHPNAKNLMRIFQLMLLRCFAQAHYSPKPLGHWGLGFTSYCHFTSPIRRYPDLVVHRVLLSLLNKQRPLYSLGQMKDLGIQTSTSERKAVDAERDIMKLKIIRYIMENRISDFSGFINGFRPDRIYFELKNLPVEAIVEAHQLTGGQDLQVSNFSVFIKPLGRKVQLGEEWQLQLLKIDPEDMQIICRPVFVTSRK